MLRHHPRGGEPVRVSQGGAMTAGVEAQARVLIHTPPPTYRESVLHTASVGGALLHAALPLTGATL